MAATISYTVLAAVCWLGGWKYMLSVFKKKETELSKKQKIILEISSGVLLEGLAVLLALALVNVEIMAFFEAMRSELVICALLFAGIIDFKLKIIPNKLTLALLILTVIVYAIEFICYPNPDYIMYVAANALSGCAVCFIIFFIGRLISRKGMGMGDIKLTAVMGLALGISNALGCLLWSLVAASLTGIVLLIAKKLNSKSKMPMAPFFFAGTVVGHIILAVGGSV